MSALDAAYQTQRQRLTHLVTNTVAHLITLPATAEDQAQTIQKVVPVVEAGQSHVVSLVSAYMAAKTAAATGKTAAITLSPDLYLTSVLRGVPAAEVYQRPFTVIEATRTRTSDDAQALQSGRAQAAKLAATDLQLAQTRAARDYMTATPSIVGYRRVLTGPGPHCKLCEAAATRTYRKSELMPIHEHCGCTVEPLWGTEPVASVGTSVLVQHDPELGPRLMADTWSDVGPRLTY